MKTQKDTTLRTKDTYPVHIYDFINEAYIICPQCSKQALVKGPLFNPDKFTLSCFHCGFNKEKIALPGIVSFGFQNTPEENSTIIGAEIDPYFHHPLWLAINCCSNILWAYNYEHLNFLEKHISSLLRERNTTVMSNNNLGSRLPAWMTSAKNREDVLRAIQKLKAKK